MGKEEITAVSEILASKTKFRRVLYIIGAILLTAAVVLIAGFYLGAITYNG